ncbi:hypothetical protein F5146DRAFT_1005895 [Armillaria mellea]|nr:hypothetical protein F5146DRAFT_1005895 [Armillaria mellea]
MRNPGGIGSCNNPTHHPRWRCTPLQDVSRIYGEASVIATVHGRCHKASSPDASYTKSVRESMVPSSASSQVGPHCHRIPLSSQTERYPKSTTSTATAQPWKDDVSILRPGRSFTGRVTESGLLADIAEWPCIRGCEERDIICLAVQTGVIEGKGTVYKAPFIEGDTRETLVPYRTRTSLQCSVAYIVAATTTAESVLETSHGHSTRSLEALESAYVAAKIVLYMQKIGRDRAGRGVTHVECKDKHSNVRIVSQSRGDPHQAQHPGSSTHFGLLRLTKAVTRGDPRIPATTRPDLGPVTMCFAINELLITANGFKGWVSGCGEDWQGYLKRT